MKFRFKIIEGANVTYSDWQPDDSPQFTALVAEALRFQHPTAALQIERGPTDPALPPSPIVGFLANDPDPTLSSDLKLNSHGIVGTLDRNVLTVDGGLL